MILFEQTPGAQGPEAQMAGIDGNGKRFETRNENANKQPGRKGMPYS